MAALALARFVDLLARLHLLDAAQLDKLRGSTDSGTEPKLLAHDLIQQGWLTAYQANLLLQGRGEELLLGSYVLLDKLGEGGMGAVFRARNWKLGRVVAIKLIRKERLASSDAVRRFYREIQAASRLDHPHVVRAFDADEVNGTHFFVMEFVEGVDLAKLVQKHGPLPLALACEYIRQAALGLQHAHEHGLVHRDIKPANLLLSKDSATAIIKVLDLGLARWDDEHNDERSATLTQVGMVMGTPDFMAPEQSVSPSTVDIRGDLYGLGCSLYFLLTGSVPFPGGSMTEKLLKHQLDEPAPLETLRADVPPLLADLVRKLMAKKREDRFQTPGELAAALADIRPSLSAAVSTNAPRPNQVADAFWEGIVRSETGAGVTEKVFITKRQWTIIGSVLAILLVVGMALGFAMWRPATHRPSPLRFLIGANPERGAVQECFRGIIDEVRISNSVRYTADFAPAPRFHPDSSTLALYHFDEGDGSVALDASRHERHGAVHGAMWVAGDAKPSPPPDSPPPPDATIIDLLPLIDFAKDSVHGTWQRNKAGELFCDAELRARIRIPYRPPPEYDLRVAFTRSDGNDAVTQTLIADGRQFTFAIGAISNTVSGFGLVNQRNFRDNRTAQVKAAWLENGRRYQSSLQVRRDGVKAYLDGQQINHLTNLGEVAMPKAWELEDSTVPGLGSWSSTTLFHSIEVVEISGPGSFTRPDDPAARAAESKRGARKSS